MGFLHKLAIVIVNYNVKFFLEQALITVQKASLGIKIQVIVVDNNSVDGSLDMLEEKFPEVTVIANKENVGFSRANNQGINLANAEYVLLLNPDTVLEEDTLLKCINFMDTHQEAGALGVKMIDGKGNFLPESKRGLPTPEVAFYKLFGFSKLFPKSRIFGKYHLTYLDKDKTHEVEVLSGAFMFMRSKTLEKTGLLDETFFMYGEDVDLSYRITKSGYKNYYFADTSIIHYKGESTQKTSIKYIWTFYQAMMIFAEKHFSGNRAKVLSAIINTGIYLKITYELVKQRFIMLLPFLLEILVVWAIMIPISKYWGLHVKKIPSFFDDLFLYFLLPVYCGSWVLVTYFSGGYDKPFNLMKIGRGIFVATIIISSVTNFIEDIRYSKGLLVVGALIMFIVMVVSKYLIHFVKSGNFDIHQRRAKNALLLGSFKECQRVHELVKKSSASIKVLGYLNEINVKNADIPFLGSYNQFDEVIDIYKIEEVLFCSKDITSKGIIHYMSKTKNQKVDFKIIPHETDYIIGSNSTNSQGNIYTIDIVFSILQEEQIRNKRLVDIVFVLFALCFSPILIFLQKNKINFVRNILNVLIGNRTWVGLSRNSKLNLKRVSPAVLSCVNIPYVDGEGSYKLEIDYAKNYNIYRDIEIFFKNLSNLDD